jgi:hypothetical protein
MVLHASLASAQGRRRFINRLVAASRDGERVVPDLVTDERGMVAAVFPAKPDSRIYYLERVSADETEGVRVLVLRPNRTKRLARNPVKLMQGEPYEITASPQAFVQLKRSGRMPLPQRVPKARVGGEEPTTARGATIIGRPTRPTYIRNPSAHECADGGQAHRPR